MKCICFTYSLAFYSPFYLLSVKKKGPTFHPSYWLSRNLLLTKLNFTKFLLIEEEVVRHVIMSASNKHYSRFCVLTYLEYTESLIMLLLALFYVWKVVNHFVITLVSYNFDWNNTLIARFVVFLQRLNIKFTLDISILPKYKSCRVMLSGRQ